MGLKKCKSFKNITPAIQTHTILPTRLPKTQVILLITFVDDSDG